MMMPGALFSLRYAGSVGYYAAMLRFGSVALDCTESYDKRHKFLNRMIIAGTNGVQPLSAPLQKPNRSMRNADVQLSEHGNWRHNHWGALFSAYGRTPFFDYFADDLKAVFNNPANTSVAALDMALHCAVIDFLDLPVETSVLGCGGGCEGLECADMRDSVFSGDDINTAYYQIWADRHGFVNGLSILDLLFNVGREAVFYLK